MSETSTVASPSSNADMLNLLKNSGVKAPEVEITQKEETPVTETVAETKEEPVFEQTKPAETVADTKETVTEKKEETAAPEKKWYEAIGGDKKSEAKDAEDTTDYKKEYSTLMQDPLLKAIAEGKKTGKSVNEVLNEIKPVDYRSMDLEQLAQSYGKLRNWSEEDISDEVSKMDGKTRTEIENITDTWLNKLESEQRGKMEQFANVNAQDAAKVEEQKRFIQKSFESELKQTCDLMLANEINGVKLTKEDANDFIKTTVEEFSSVREDGTIAVKDAAFYYWLGKNISKFMSAAKAEGASTGKEEAMKDINRPNLQTSSPQRQPDVKQPLTEDQKAAQLLKAGYGKV